MSEPTSWSRRPILLFLSFIVVITGRVNAEDAIREPPELPQPIWQALLNDESLVLMADIEQLLWASSG